MAFCGWVQKWGSLFLVMRPFSASRVSSRADCWTFGDDVLFLGVEVVGSAVVAAFSEGIGASGWLRLRRTPWGRPRAANDFSRSSVFPVYKLNQ